MATLRRYVVLPRALPAWLAPVALALFGLVAATGVGYLTAQNSAAQPADIAVLVRVLIIVTIAGTAVYAQTNMYHRRMAILLAGACVVTSAWLLNGSLEPWAFSVGVIFTAPAVVVAYYVLLAHPSGMMTSRRELGFIAAVGSAGIVLWTAAVLISGQPPFRMPVVTCAPHCPANVLRLGTEPVFAALRVAIRVVWATLAIGTLVLVDRRWRLAPGPLRRTLWPARVVLFASTLCLVGFLVAQALGGDRAMNGFGTAYIVTWVAIPLAILAGLASERLFMGQALARFVTGLVDDGAADPRLLMAQTLQDPSLSIAYARPTGGGYVDFSGAEIETPDDEDGREVAWIHRDGRRIAALTYDRELADQRRFMEAAGDAAVMRLEQAQLVADLRASTADLAASRLRLVETAQAERKRLERDLHDSVQQDLLGLRLKLDLAAEALTTDPTEGQQIICEVGRGLDDVLNSLRDLARGIYPQLLLDRGVVEAVRSAARRAPIAVSVRAGSVRRVSEDIEVAIYYCCVEAVQNVAKHGGPGARANVRFWQDAEDTLHFEVVDDGDGFDGGDARAGRGLTNMRDRIEAVGGGLMISSHRGQGTVVRGRVPLA